MKISERENLVDFLFWWKVEMKQIPLSHKNVIIMAFGKKEVEMDGEQPFIEHIDLLINPNDLISPPKHPFHT